MVTTECDLTKAYSANSKRRTVIRILDSINAECKRKLSVDVFGASTKMVDSETPKCEQQALPAKSTRRKKCDHVRSAFRVYVWRPNRLSLLSLNSRSNCFGNTWVLARRVRKERKFLARRKNLLVLDGVFLIPEYRSVNRAVSNVEGLKLKITAHKTFKNKFDQICAGINFFIARIIP